MVFFLKILYPKNKSFTKMTYYFAIKEFILQTFLTHWRNDHLECLQIAVHEQKFTFHSVFPVLDCTNFHKGPQCKEYCTVCSYIFFQLLQFPLSSAIYTQCSFAQSQLLMIKHLVANFTSYDAKIPQQYWCMALSLGLYKLVNG